MRPNDLPKAQDGIRSWDGFRKYAPVYDGFIKYWPNAITAVAELSRVANEQHNPGEPIHWAKEKSKDELNALMSHLIKRAGGRVYDDDRIRHLAKVAWRAMSALEREITGEEPHE